MNQADCLARALGRRTGMPVAPVLSRVPSTTPQVRLARDARLTNARGSVRACRAPPDGRLTLVDDVYTTGATLDACARALRDRGAPEVVAVTFARALR
jgi:predicted amidophosphoribosyltransferase